MDQQIYVLEFAHSVSGRVKRIHVSPKFFAYVGLGVFLVCIAATGLVASYLRMTWRVAHYNQLRTDFDHLRNRYKELQRVSHQHSEQMASLETLASEVSVAYGINPPATEASSEAKDYGSSLMPDAKESIQEFNFLKAASYSGIYHRYAFQWQSHTQPSLWPINGLLRSSFGGRFDPFSGEGAFHTGVDLSAPVGTPVHVTADGVVQSAGWSGRYGKLVVVDHGNGMQTYYAHLSQFLVVPGQEVRRNQVVALSGRTGRATGPHVHYEVRLGGTPVNPYKYLSKLQFAAASRASHNDLGL